MDLQGRVPPLLVSVGVTASKVSSNKKENVDNADSCMEHEIEGQAVREPQRSSCDEEDKWVCTQTNALPVSSCLVSFTGFRDVDEWPGEDTRQRLSDDDDENVSRRSELEVFQQLATERGVVVQPTLTSSTDVLVARRGFTRKRLLATHRRMPVVLPRWVEEGCPRAMAPDGPSSLHAACSIAANYAVPWLHGYVFSTTGLTTEEKVAIERVCTQPQHGAVVEASLTYRCDALLTSGECIRQLHELLRRESVESQDKDQWQRSRTLRLWANAGGTSSTKTGSEKNRTSENAEADGASWLTAKLRFALEFDIPVVDYVRFFSSLRLEKLPPPSLGLSVSAIGATEKASAIVADRKRWRDITKTNDDARWTRDEENALMGGDFDSVLGACRMAAPVGGASRWQVLLEHVAQRRVECASLPNKKAATDAEADALSSASRSEKSVESLEASSRSSSSSTSLASTVSDPDAWVDFMQHDSMPYHGPDAGSHKPAEQPQQRIEVYPIKGRSDPQKPSVNLSLNTIDVDVQPTAAEPSTMLVSTADYYTESGTRRSAEEFTGSASTVNADSYHDSYAGVDPSPRLTTNALLQRQPPPLPLGKNYVPVPQELLASGTQGVHFEDRLAAYYAAQRSDHQQQQLQHTAATAAQRSGERLREAAPWQVPSSRFSTSLNSDHVPHPAQGETHTSDTYPSSTQVLVESCSTADEQREVLADRPAAAGSVNQGVQLAGPSLSAARMTLPLWALHPPYLTVSLLGCTEAETVRARVWCGVCRFLRSPIPTVETDVVILGSELLVRKKYIVPTTQSARGRSPSRWDLRASAAAGQRRGRSPHPSTKQPAGRLRGDKSEDGAVCVRCWELDATIAHALAEACGIGKDRIAPLRWLEDAAAAATQKAAAEAADKQKRQSSAQANHPAVPFTEEDTATLEVTTSTPQDTLADLVQERLDALDAQEQKEGADMDTVSPMSINEAFFPYPALQPEELPPLASSIYCIRLRRSFSSLGTAAAPASLSSPILTKDNKAALTAAEVTVDLKAKPPLPLQQQLQPRFTSSASPACGPFTYGVAASHKDKAGLVAPPGKNEGADMGSTTSPRELGDAATGVAGTQQDSAAVSFSGAVTPRPQSVRSATTTATSLETGATTAAATNQEEEQKLPSHDAELAVAGRRFNQLLALFQVQVDDNGDTGCESGQGTIEVVQVRRQLLQSCCFCCLEGEFARTDWAVVRGLVRYGGGRVEKKSAEAWAALLVKAKGKNQGSLGHNSQASSNTSTGEEGDDAVAQRRLALRVRRNLELEKQQRKIARSLLREERNDTRDTTKAAAAGQAELHQPQASAKASIATATTKEELHRETPEVVKEPGAKLASIARTCQQFPTFYLLPHSFQRAPVTGEAGRGASARVASAVATLPGSRHNPLHGLSHVTQDYVLACLAVGSCLHPRSCFLFYAAIPSAPDVRLFHARSQPPPLQRANADGVGQLDTIAPMPQRPALSIWTREKRYSKPESVGVCVTFLWQLPCLDTCWVSAVDVVPQVVKPPTVSLPSPSAMATREAGNKAYVPSAQLVPLIRVLLLGFRNAVEAMGGHVVDAFSATSVTHVVAVDLEAIVSSSLCSMYSSEVIRQNSEGEGMESADATKRYWPADAVEEMVQCAAQHELSVVSLPWLASCVEWGAFVDEAGFAPPVDLQAHITKRQQQKKQQRQQHRHSASALLPHQAMQLPSRQHRSQLSAQSIRDGSAARAAEERKRARTPSPPPPSPSPSPRHTTHTPDPRRATAAAAPHTPPRSSLNSHTAAQQLPLRDASAPSFPFITTHPAFLHEEEASALDRHSRGNGEVHTPVLRRLQPPSTSHSNSNVEPCTPPPRPPQPMHSTFVRDRHAGVDPQNNSPSLRAPCLSTPVPAASRRSLSGSARRHRTSLSASQHNTYTQAERQDAEAYVEHLGEMFNFCSPGSTPLPSSARRGRQHSLAAAQDAGTEGSVLPEAYRERVLQGVLQGQRDALQHEGLRSASLPGVAPMNEASARPSGVPVQTPQATQLSHTGTQLETSASSHALCTPRRRTLRAVAEAAAAVASAGPSSSFSGSPDRHRRRAEDSPLDNTTNTRDKSGTKRGSSIQCEEGAAAAAAAMKATKADRLSGIEANTTGHLPVEKTRVVPVVLGGSTLLSRGGTERGSRVLHECDSGCGQQVDDDSSRVSGRGPRGQRSASAEPPTRQSTAAVVEVLGKGAAPALLVRHGEDGKEDGDVSVVRNDSSADNKTSSPPPPQPPKLADGGHSFSTIGPAQSSDDETTTPLPCVAAVTQTATTKKALENAQGELDYSVMADVIPDSQPDAPSDILVPSSFIAATEGAYSLVDDVAEARVASNPVEDYKPPWLDGGNVQTSRPSLELVGGETHPVPTHVEASLHMQATPSERGTIDTSQAKNAVSGGNAGALVGRDARPRLGTCSAPRQPSPSPVPPSLRQVVDVVDVDSDQSKREADPTATTVTDGKTKQKVGAPPQPHSTISPEPISSPWTSHRPLSLSRRSSHSHSPAPASRIEATRVASAKSTVACPAIQLSKGAHTAAETRSFCLRVYVLHDLPLRAQRMQRCYDALQAFSRDRHSPITPTMANRDAVNTNKDRSHRASERTTAADDVGRRCAPSDAVLQNVPPMRFVSRCEDADICVTHEVSLRESVLVAIAVGCWVLQPGFLECVAAVLEGSSNSSSNTKQQRDEGGAPNTLHLLPYPSSTSTSAPPAATTSPSPTTVACYHRLCEMCTTYEWTLAPAAATTAYSPLLRSLVWQCRRQRQAAQARLRRHRMHEGGGELTAVRSAEGRAGGLASVFACHSFLLLCGAQPRLAVSADKTSAVKSTGSVRAEALRRLLTAGGGCVVSVVTVGCVEKSYRTAQPAQLAHSPLSQTKPLWMEDGLLRCCARYSSSSSSSNHSDRDRKADSSLRALADMPVTDEDFYHDLVYLLVEAVWRHGDLSLSTTAETTEVASRSLRRSSIAKEKHAERENQLARPLVVLIDASIFEFTRSTKETLSEPCVTLTKACRGAAGHEGPLTPLSYKRRRSEETAQSNDKSEMRDPKRTTMEHANAAASATAGSVGIGAWLARWLPLSEGRCSNGADEDSPLYTPAAQRALRSHLSACCSLAHHLHRVLARTEGLAADVTDEALSSARSSLFSRAEAKWAFKAGDLPFDAPALDELCRLILLRYRPEVTCELAAVALAREETKSTVVPQLVEFRSSGWAGGCVAAGGSAKMAARVESGALSSQGCAGVCDNDEWMRACDAQTLLAVLPYA